MSLLGTQLLLQRILRKPTSSGGGALTANSVDSSHIINGSITGADLSNNITGLSNLYASTILTDELTVTDILTVNNDLTTSNANITSLIVSGGSTLGSYGNNTLVGGDLTCDGTTTMNIGITVNGSTNCDTFQANEGVFNNELTVNGDIYTLLLSYKTIGANKAYGTATLVGGTVTVTTIFAQGSTSKIFLSRNNVVNANHMGHLYVVKGNGSFQIVSTNNQDNNVVDYIIFFGL